MTDGVPTALVVAGSDSSGTAGIQADLRALDATGVHGLSVVTLVTARNRRGVNKVEALRGELVRAQLAAATEAGLPRSVKIGALGNAAVVEIVADAVRAMPGVAVVLDPVVMPMQGRVLLDESGFTTLVRELLPAVALLVPNREEATRLLGKPVTTPRQMRAAAQGLVALGPRAVLLKGGHFDGAECIDLFHDGTDFVELRAPRRALPAVQGLGCTLSSLVAASLAQGLPMSAAVARAHAVVQHAMENLRTLANGASMLGPLDAAVRAVDVQRASDA